MDSKISFLEILANSIEEADVNTPVFFILSPGSDPVKDVEEIARTKGIIPGKTFFYLALG